MQPFCREKGVKIAVETLFCASAKSFLTLFERLFQRYETDFIGLCLDIGHWEMLEPSGLSVLERYGSRLSTTHVHDNFGATDDHLLPFDGRIDWDAFAKAVSATSYQPPLVFETHMDRYGMPEGAFYQRAHKAAMRLERMIAANRASSNRLSAAQ